MHEFSVVQALLMQVEDIAKEHNANSVEKIYVVIGEVSGVEPHLLKMAFDTFKENTIASKADLVIEFQKPHIYCMECQKEFSLERYSMRCPSCGSFKVKLTKGDELILKTLELDT
ncbi:MULTISPECIES: hydrogenase maturation nickel metallochaperone HypA [unclassified Hydrogenobaculum]|uniref:hydrogenase maturation nickel metallochaperone HypA n=1 Tax=unclassified Hydrogenobaculum TaxID=2622382 RepID=UPI0001C52AA9|nr:MULTISPECIES: hydrogenase maturation nickel metallochaperone HypA [unclassified Hydrogenobaculum]AEF18458.1 hydrogenase nickel insertion protein HypA [Hydrogenobaculum sp. 3684]AEG45748.1 hydrogenase nickel incorporation protein hypA [Hydrogenobaculum sp. SHO]AGG14390.1 Hydrogenase-3 nickel incorporation protein HypA [Hydrogenobaculum sp. HO]AGH92694.1 Hydrogenase-3 nickel incorporation protein HypA [Hydrogenobaculum sp. SN]